MKKTNISVDLSKTSSPFKPLHGVVNGPYHDAYPFTDVTERYKEAGVPFVRLHDTTYPHATEVDVSAIFPDFSADPDDPASYHFGKTDVYLQCVRRTGAEIRYRLGESISKHRIDGAKISYQRVGTLEKEDVRPLTPPSDPEKWAKICVGIARHYNDGWSNGFHFGIKTWEIWEEADGKDFLWFGTDEEFYRLYDCTARALKAYDPSLTVGGFAMCSVKGRESFLRGFLKYTRDNHVPLDFFSFDLYSNNPDDYAELPRYTRSILRDYGYDGLPMKLCEWNNFGFDPGGTCLFTGSPELLTWKLDRQHGLMGAAFYAAAMLRMQETELEDAAVYVFNPSSEFSVFNLYGVPFKGYWAFAAYNHLYQAGLQAETASDSPVYCLSGWNGRQGAVLLSNFDWGDEPSEYTLRLRGLPNKAVIQIRLLDDAHNLEPVSDLTVSSECDLTFTLPPNALLLLDIAVRS